MWEAEQLRRIQILAVIVILVIAALIVRLGWMQLLQGAQYKRVAEENRIRQITDQAPRGTIYDRNGAPVVSNRPSFAVSIIPAEYTNSDATTVVAGILGMDAGQITSLINAATDAPYTPVRLKRDVDAEAITIIQERKYYLPGVIIEALPLRYYIYNELAANIFGYLGTINEEEYETRKRQGYHMSDMIGKDGLERVWEDVLRGQDGGLQVEVNAMGEEVKSMGEKPSVPGKGIVLTLDANLQKAAEQALQAQVLTSRSIGQPAKGGAVVVMDVHTGGVLAMVSNPSYNPNLFAAGIASAEWNKLISDADNPLANKAIQNAYPPGSVFKIITAAAALDLGLTTSTEIFHDRGVYVLNGWSFYGWDTKGLGDLDIAGALTWSSDPVFYELGRRIGADQLASYALTFGIGKKTGIKLLGEANGMVPTEEWKQQTYGEPWYPGESLIAAIGQGYYLVTPLQQAMLLMAVANEGVMYRPRLVDKLLAADGSSVIQQFAPEIEQTVYLRPEIWSTIRKGLIGVTTQGTGAGVFQQFPVKVAGKSGSAETGRGTTHSWFACYAPADKPEIVMAVLVEEGGEGSSAAAPVVRKVLEAYFAVPSKTPSVPAPGTTD